MLKRFIILLFLIYLTTITVSGAFTGSFTHETHGNIVTLIPNLGSNVDHYKFFIENLENNIESETPWISTDDNTQTSFALRRGDYTITMYFKNCTLNDFTSDFVHVVRQEETSASTPLTIIEEEGRIKSITESIPEEISDWYNSLNFTEKILFFLSIGAIILIAIFSRDEKFKYYIVKRKK